MNPATALPRPLPAGPVFRALADPTRIRVLHLLRRGPLCVGDIVSILGMAQPKVSRHLAYLRQAGLVENEKRGLWCFYRLAPPAAGFHQKLLEVLEAAAEQLPDVATDEAASRRLRAKGGCCPQHEIPRRRR